MRPAVLTQSEITERLKKLAPWTCADNKLKRTFGFKDFREAFAFMTVVAEEAEALNHHPDWKNIYNQLWVELNTHDAGGVTELDFELAQKMENHFKEFSQNL